MPRLPPGPRRDFVQALHELYAAAGMPSTRTISVAVRRNQSLPDTVSHETIKQVLHGDSVPAWQKVECLVRVLAEMAVHRPDPQAELTRMQPLWHAAYIAPPDPPQQEPEPPVPPPRPDPPPNPPPRLVPAVPPPRPGPVHLLADPPILGDLPARNPAFTGRDALLGGLAARLSVASAPPVVLIGLTGVGKTQLAVEYVHRNLDRYDLVWWIPAEQSGLARAALVNLADRLDVPPSQDMQQTVGAVLAELANGRRRWLLVFDNAEDENVRMLLPRMGGHTIVTSRDPAWATAGQAVEVGVFDRAESIQYLRRRDRGISAEDSGRLADLIGDLPMALEILATLLDTGITRAELLAAFDESALDEPGGDRSPNYPVITTASLRVALDRLRAESADAADLFELFAYLGTEPVSLTLLRSGRDGRISAPLAQALRDPFRINRAVATLNRYGLAKVHLNGQRIQVPRLIRIALRSLLPEQVRQAVRADVHGLLAAANPGPPDDLPNWELHDLLAPHVLPAGLIQADDVSARRVVLDQIRYLYLTGDYEGCRSLGERAVVAWRRPPEEGGLGADHELTLLATREWANGLRSLGQYERSRQLTEEAMRRLENSPRYGPEHPHTLSMAISVGADLRIAGQYRQALQLDRRNLDRHIARHGPDHPSTVFMQSNLAVNMRMTGDFEQAYQIDEQVLDKRRELFGDNHALTLLSVSNLARDLYGLGHYREALDLQNDFMAAYRERLGSRHSEVLLATRTIVIAHRKCGEYAEALALAEQNYHDYHARVGADHEHTLAAVMSYANALRAVGRLPEARDLAVEGVGTYRRRFGGRNPLTLAAEVNLAVILRATGDRRRARQADEQSLSALFEVLGDDHPFTLCAATNLATDLALDHDNAAARALSERTLTSLRLVRGDEHPDTLAAAGNLALDLQAAGEVDAAQELIDQTLAALRRALGASHPAVLEAAGGRRAECDIEPSPT